MVINIKTALDDCAEHVAHIRRRNTTLIDYYISPKPVPTAIAEYDPRLATLQNRIKTIKKLNFSQLEQLIDDPDCYAASHLQNIITELLHAILGYQHLFEQYYDPNIAQREFYTPTFNSLKRTQQRLHELLGARLSNPNRPRAEHRVAHRNNNTTSSRYHFCRGAIQVLNNADRGRIAAVADDDLLSSNRADLSAEGGAFLWWQCPIPSCTFKLRFHIVGSQALSIHNNSEIRRHPSVPLLEYRSAFLIKSHLHSTSEGSGGDEDAKYGCLFCFAEGKPLETGCTTFPTGRELAMHICGAHKGGKLPPAMVLEKIKVAVNGKCPVGVKRWDANFLTG